LGTVGTARGVADGWTDRLASSAFARALKTPRGRVGAGLAGLVLLVAALGPLIAPHSPTELLGAPLVAPSSHNLLGTDTLGRDVLSRVLWGGWETILLASIATAIGVGLGAAIGIAAAFRGGVIDAVLMRCVDVVLAFPQLVFALLLVSIYGPRLWLVVLAVAVAHAPQVARVIRSAALDISERDFVKSAELTALPSWKVMGKEILPNLTSPLMVEGGLRLTWSIIIIAGLSFLGFGIQPPTPSWGGMINENRLGLASNPWAVIAPAVMIALLTVGTNLVTDAIARVSLGIERAGLAIAPPTAVMVEEVEAVE
jgi:peptide/nickel transport system permease protein